MNICKIFKVFLAASIIAVLSSSCATDPAKNADKAIASIMEKHGNVGVSAVFVKDGAIVYQKNFGYKDIDKKTPIENDDIFRIASISKSFVATSIMQLVEQGKLSLDDDVSDLIGFTVRNPRHPKKVITLRSVLSHTSSMSDAGGYFTLDPINPKVTNDQSKSYYEYEPGTDYNYCNLGYNLAGTIVEKISGVRFDEYVRTNIFNKLGLYGGHNVNLLDASKFIPIYEWDAEKGAFGRQDAAYNPRKKDIENYVMGYSTPIFSPTGGIKISAGDLAKYMTMHMNFGELNGVRVISEESAKEMQKINWHYNDNTGYGLAITTADHFVNGKLLKGHTGSAYGLYSVMFFHPEEKWGIVVITNGVKEEYRKFQQETMNLLYDTFGK